MERPRAAATMADVSDPRPSTERPVVTGLVALVAVALAVGAILALAAVVGTRVLGIGGDSGGGSGTAARESMFLPTPQETDEPGGPRVTLNTSEPSPSASTDVEPTPTEVTTSAAPGQISLQSASTSVAAGGRIYFSGVYEGGEGAILFVQRFEDGAWADFPASVGVTGGQFSSYLFTGVSGVNRFRVIDRDNNVTSNEISVQVG